MVAGRGNDGETNNLRHELVELVMRAGGRVFFTPPYHLRDIIIPIVIQQYSERTGIYHTLDCYLMILIGRVMSRSRYFPDANAIEWLFGEM
jgi:hypothetical protein